MVKIPKKVSERLNKEITPYQKILTRAKERDINKFDTITIVVDMLAHIFGYDKFADITSEQSLQYNCCDLAVKREDKIKFLVEVKPVGLDLTGNFLSGLGENAAHDIPWIVHTNGIAWEVYKIGVTKPVNYELICSFSFTQINFRKQDDQAKLYLLCKEGIDKAAIEEFHEHTQSVNRFVIGALVQSDPVVAIIRRELRKLMQSSRITEEQIKSILNTEVLKREVTQGEDAGAAIKRIKIARKKQATPKAKLNAKAKHKPRAQARSRSETIKETIHELESPVEANRQSEPVAGRASEAQSTRQIEAQFKSKKASESMPREKSPEKAFDPNETTEFELPDIDLDAPVKSWWKGLISNQRDH